MSAEAPKSAPVVQPFPTTVEELHLYVAQAVSQILSVPDNALALAQTIFSTGARATAEVNGLLKVAHAKAVVTRIEYAGCAKATVKQEIPGGEFTTVLEERINGEWAPLVREDYVIQGLNRLVLSQAVYPEDVWYITTTEKVHAEQDALIDRAASATHQ